MADEYGMAEAAEMLEGELSQSFIWGSGEYPCVAGDRTDAKLLGDGGMALDADLVLVVRTDIFGDTRPVSKDLITYKSRAYRVAVVTTPPDDSIIVLTCTDDAKGV